MHKDVYLKAATVEVDGAEIFRVEAPQPKLKSYSLPASIRRGLKLPDPDEWWRQVTTNIMLLHSRLNPGPRPNKDRLVQMAKHAKALKELCKEHAAERPLSLDHDLPFMMIGDLHCMAAWAERELAPIAQRRRGQFSDPVVKGCLANLEALFDNGFRLPAGGKRKRAFATFITGIYKKIAGLDLGPDFIRKHIA